MAARYIYKPTSGPPGTPPSGMAQRGRRAWLRSCEILREKGPAHLLRAGIAKTLREVDYRYHQLLKPFRAFEFRGRNYRYACHRYNTAWRTERAVEIPVAWAEVAGRPFETILEVGNVLSHYVPVSHTVVDKYETAPGVINVDVLDFQPERKFSLIISISTLEHVGWHEEPQDARKFLRAVEHLTQLLASPGRMLVTLPLGVHPEVDRLADSNRSPFTHQFYMRRVTRDNRWEETAAGAVQGVRYNQPFRNANAIMIGFVDRA